LRAFVAGPNSASSSTGPGWRALAWVGWLPSAKTGVVPTNAGQCSAAQNQVRVSR
jgi:hypothetical protein